MYGGMYEMAGRNVKYRNIIETRVHRSTEGTGTGIYGSTTL